MNGSNDGLAHQAVLVNLVVIAVAIGLVATGAGVLAVVSLVCALVSLAMAVLKIARRPDTGESSEGGER